MKNKKTYEYIIGFNGCPSWTRTNTVPASEAGALPFGDWALATIIIIAEIKALSRKKLYSFRKVRVLKYFLHGFRGSVLKRVT